MIVYLVTAIEDIDEPDVLVLPTGSSTELTDVQMAAIPAEVHRRLLASLARRETDPTDGETSAESVPGQPRRRRKAD